MNCIKWSGFSFVLLLVGVIAMDMASAEKISDVTATRHNLSLIGPGTVKAQTRTEVCVFCHTPHGANAFPGSPLWNRDLSGATYTPYTSSSLDAEAIRGAQLAQPGGSSKLCLSCHDGTLAIGGVTNAPGSGLGSGITMTGVATDGTMPAGEGTNTGFTRDLGTDLTNDHPISLTYDTGLATTDGELIDPASGSATHIGADGTGVLLPLEATDSDGDLQIQCATCHDPHITDPEAAVSIKFLRANRFQEAAPAAGFSEVNDQICLGCHDKEGWQSSAHADPTVAEEQYADVTLREFAPGTTVARAGCLNCHDPHTVHGARRLVREGTDNTSTPKSGGESAIEETCYQCHTNDNDTILSLTGNEVPDIETEFALPIHMPINNADQLADGEVHDIGTGQDSDEGTQRGKDLIEDESLLGKGNLNNRHVECTDCHNPHRVMKNSVHDGSGSSSQATHDHGAPHSNIASGVLRGTFGVEPNYGSDAWGASPSSYSIRRGDPSTAPNPVTKEYQICLKCHSNYAYDDLDPPDPGSSGGTTASGTNNLTEYTNQAMEFQAPLGDQGEPGGNHRSWHPVVDATDRDSVTRFDSGANSDRGGNLDPFLAPWDGANIGSQTMYCSDCHGRDTGAGNATVEPPPGRPWGPHGSENDFLLKGPWSASTGAGSSNDLCFKCHEYDAYGNPSTSRDYESGFETDRGNGHYIHNTDDRLSTPIQCSWCHVAVPHGWQNKALLVDISQEPACPSEGPCNVGPYYNNAFLGSNGQSVNWAASGDWAYEDCGGDALMRDGVCDQFR